jgi:hypothetical protein
VVNFCFIIINSSVVGNELQIILHSDTKANKTILKIKETQVIGLRWFSIGSNKTLAHWLINCGERGLMQEAMQLAPRSCRAGCLNTNTSTF